MVLWHCLLLTKDNNMFFLKENIYTMKILNRIDIVDKHWENKQNEYAVG